MTQIKTSDATGAALDWLVYECEKRAGRTDVYMRWFGDGRKDAPWCNGPFKPSTDWSQGGPIVEKEKMQLSHSDGVGWGAYSWTGSSFSGHGPTPLIAAMRCFVSSRLGEVVEVPDELA